MFEQISSKDNKYFKFLKKLNEKKYRDENSIFIAEGEKFFFEDKNFIKIVVKENKVKYFEDKYELSKYDNVIILSDLLFDKISSQDNSQGIIFIYSKQVNKLDDLIGDLVILDDVQDPGNIGTIIRTMVATNYVNLILTSQSVDVYSPKVVRATMGGIFKINIIYENKENIIKYLKDKQYNIISTALLKESIDYREVNLIENKNAYIFGHEGSGVSNDFLEISNQKAIIPIYGNIESLNVSIALGVFLYKMREK